jgi:serine O-acetyltransferase
VGAEQAVAHPDPVPGGQVGGDPRRGHTRHREADDADPIVVGGEGKRHPTVGDRVTIGAGAKVLGPITIGHDSRIAATAVVVKLVPPDSVVVGVPGQVVSRSRPRPATAPPDLDHTRMPDLIGTTLTSLLTRVEELERLVDGKLPEPPTTIHPSEAGVWRGEDFSI